MQKKILLFLILFSLIQYSSCTTLKNKIGTTKSEIYYKNFTLDPLPAWTDKFNDFLTGDNSFFMISRLTKNLNLTNLQAIELQNHFRDLTTAGDSSQNAFLKALEKVRALNFESRIDPNKIEAAPFIIVLDIDDTLLNQYYTMWERGRAYYDYKIDFKTEERAISLAPGWQTLLSKIKDLGGLLIIFSANYDDSVWKILNTVTINNTKLSNFVDGVMTYNYLILEGKHEWTEDVIKSAPITTPSKDLRLIDPTLKKIIIIDDNQTKIIQPHRLRHTIKYKPDTYFTNNLLAEAYQSQLMTVLKEIEESLKYSQKSGLSFADSFYPYTQEGHLKLKFLTEKNILTRQKAFQYLRSNLWK